MAPAGAPDEVVCPRCKLHFAPRGQKSSTDRGDRPAVLLVDRPGFFLDALRAALGTAYDVRTAGSIAEAERIFARSRVDLMILDPGVEGDCKRLLPGPLRKLCPVLIYMAGDEAEIYGERWEELQALGADDIVVKGMRAAESLSRKVATLLGRPTDDDPDEP